MAISLAWPLVICTQSQWYHWLHSSQAIQRLPVAGSLLQIGQSSLLPFFPLLPLLPFAFLLPFPTFLRRCERGSSVIFVANRFLK